MKKMNMNFSKSFILLILILIILYLLFSPYLHKTKEGLGFLKSNCSGCSNYHSQNDCSKCKNCTWKQQLNHNGSPVMNQGKPKYECSSF